MRGLKLNNIINLILIATLIGCLFNMPYGYYQLSRIIVISGSIALFVMSIQSRNYVVSPLYALIAIVFNPFIKLAFERNEWQIIDVVAIIILLVIIGTESLKPKSKT